ncbi:radical SAM/SPASM domain-containing protein [Terasakiella sp.]|uniref:radical SAM/SPASM domain-containing protein n=1 Tax=Terasakiella sp. TaxID=2034861 RepID=UPI003AA9482A
MTTISPNALSDIQGSWTEILDTDPVPATARAQEEDTQRLFVSSDFELEVRYLYMFILRYNAKRAGGVTFGIRRSSNKEWLRYKTAVEEGEQEIGISFYAERAGVFHLAIEPDTYTEQSNIELSDITVEVIKGDQAQERIAAEVSTYLPHWGPVKRKVHDWCREYSWFNGLVAQLEMRFDKEEVLSLPQFMSFCPTGQCNASCEFCSVTVNRTGVIKRQLPMDRLRQLVAPVAKVVRMFGLEGNGEPTLYREFDELNSLLRQNSAKVYLITNGAVLREDQIPDLLGFESINFSLNAASAETHKKVMRLKNFDHIVDIISKLTVAKKNRDVVLMDEPHISVSFVITNDSIHEIVDFIKLADQDMKVDKIFLRPLSEIATELGANEDFRDLVPYENDVQDALAEVEHYQNKVGVKNSLLYIDPSAFRAVRPDPIDRLVRPKGFENSFLLPRENLWNFKDQVSGESLLNMMKLSAVVTAKDEELCTLPLIPVLNGEKPKFKLDYVHQGVPVQLVFKGSNGTEISRHIMEDVGEGVAQSLEITLDLPDGTNGVFVSLLGGDAEGEFKAEWTVERFRVPGRGLRKEFKLPHPGKWEMSVEGVGLNWEGSKVSLEWHGKPGPYLLKNFSVETFRNEQISIPLKVEVESGELVIGVLSEDFSSWEQKFTFEKGSHDTALEWNTGDNRRVQLVMFQKSKTEPLMASVDWLDILEPLPKRGSKDAEESKPLTSVAFKNNELGEGTQPDAVPVAKPSFFKKLGDSISGTWSNITGAFSQAFTGPDYTGKQSWLHRFLWGKERFYCQKPWTDLNNFSVDGRIDVCCIATGPSQAKYQWGNLLFQSFQEVWNSKVAQEFRRTVNGKDPLPPCARCPMTKSFQAPYFDYLITLHEIYQRILHIPIFGKPLWNVPGGRGIALALYGPCHLFVHLFLMRGFKRKWGWHDVTRRG